MRTRPKAFHPDLHRRRLANGVGIIVGMVFATSVPLRAIANHLPDDTDAAARITKLRRWRKHPCIHTRLLYEPVITHVLYVEWLLRVR